MYVPLDVNFPDSEKVVGCSMSAIGLYVTALCVCKRLQNDGTLSRLLLRRYGDDDADATITELVDAGLFTLDGDAIGIPAWLRHNQASDEYMSSDKGSRMAHTRWHEGRGVVKEGCEWCEAANVQVDASPCPPEQRAYADDAAGHMQEVEIEQEIEIEKSRQAPPSSDATVRRAKDACLLKAQREIAKRLAAGEPISNPDAVATLKAKADLWPVLGEQLTDLATAYPDATPAGLIDAFAAAGAPSAGPPAPRNIYRVSDDRWRELEANRNGAA